MPTSEDPSTQRAIPLASLEYLQSQRRGSITDPSLHAAKHPQNLRVVSEPSSSSSTPQDPRDEPRPSSTFVFGDATAQASDGAGLRKLLRSPSAERTEDKGEGEGTSEDAVTGTKRKMSADREEEKVVEMTVDGPAPKRRMSSIDTSRIAKLSLDDRRHSVDARWYTAERTSSYPPAFPGPPLSWNSMQHPNPNNIVMIPPINYPPDRRMSVPDSRPTRVLRSRSRPPSRPDTSPPIAQEEQQAQATSSKPSKEPGSTPYSRSPELRVSHKLAERKRRKEMKDLFDELRDQLPADRGMKASKWEILSKAIDFVTQLKHSHQEMVREIDMLKHEIDVLRQSNGMPPQFAGGPPPPHALVYSQGPIPGPYPPLPPPGVMQHPPPPPPQQQQQQQLPQPPLSRPASSQNMFPPSQQNGNIARAEVAPT